MKLSLLFAVIFGFSGIALQACDDQKKSDQEQKKPAEELITLERQETIMEITYIQEQGNRKYTARYHKIDKDYSGWSDINWGSHSSRFIVTTFAIRTKMYFDQLDEYYQKRQKGEKVQMKMIMWGHDHF